MRIDVMPEKPILSSLVWFRRDLRSEDNAALAAACNRPGEVYGCFVFDRSLLDPLPDRDDRRVAFIRDSLAELQAAWRALATAAGPQSGVRLIFLQGDPAQLVPALAEHLRVDAVFAARDYEPQAKLRDREVAAALAKDGRRLVLVKDQVIFESDQVLTGGGQPFLVFTPYCRAWRKKLRPSELLPQRRAAAARFGRPPPMAGELPCAEDGAPALATLGFVAGAAGGHVLSGMSGARRALADFEGKLEAYRDARDFPARDGTSRLSVHLRFGTVSIRALVHLAVQREIQGGSAGAAAWLNELIWREFYMAVLDRRPDVVDHCWRPEYDALHWDEATTLFAAWAEGRTGYPFVDAAMRQLLATGFMPNRARMVVASFLCKDLGIDWRRGERFFARHLLDYDLAANNGGWQWSASTGCDAQPYFRIFNPVTQSEKFDPEGDYIRRWVPELAGVPLRYLHAPWTMPPAVRGAAGGDAAAVYPAPVVDHAAARQRTLARYARARDRG